jgi:quercetin dioxygenase-like cupin family protein
MNSDQLILRRGSRQTPKPTRRAGIKERRLLTERDSPYQNIAIMDVDHGAEVEIHRIVTSESIYVLGGKFEVILSDSRQKIGTGDICYFPPRTFHGLRCAEGPGQLLVIFAPPGYKNGNRSRTKN